MRAGSSSFFQWWKTMRDRADHLLTTTYDNQSFAICPVRDVEQYIQIGTAAGWDMTKGYLFPTITDGNGEAGPRRGTSPLSAAQMTKGLKSYTVAEGISQDFPMHSFRSGGERARGWHTRKPCHPPPHFRDFGLLIPTLSSHPRFP